MRTIQEKAARPGSKGGERITDERNHTTPTPQSAITARREWKAVSVGEAIERAEWMAGKGAR